MEEKQHYSGIGGQAVLEGVMMKNKEKYAVSVRKENGEIETMTDDYEGILHGSVLLKTPFVRGVFVFIDSMVLGMKSLNYSASLFEDEEEDKDLSEEEARERKKKNEKTESVISAAITVVSFIIAIGLFFLLPYAASSFLGKLIGSHTAQVILEGVVRLVIFLAYIWGISFMDDIHRLYQYHGAEHKCINCLESGLELNVENVKKSSRFHKRCGSSFILFVLIVSIIVFFFIQVESGILRVVLRIVLIPVISGISYELIRKAGMSCNPIINAISKPGLWTQRITTKEPDESMIEVAIASVEAIFDWRKYLEEDFGLTTGKEQGQAL